MTAFCQVPKRRGEDNDVFFCIFIAQQVSNMKSILTAILTVMLAFACAQPQPPKVLVVTAHPDDETGFSVTMFKIAREMKGVVDMAVMTDGGAASPMRSWAPFTMASTCSTPSPPAHTCR